MHLCLECKINKYFLKKVLVLLAVKPLGQGLEEGSVIIIKMDFIGG